MGIAMIERDYPIARQSLDLLDKAIDAAIKATALLGVPTLLLDGMAVQALELNKTLNSSVGKKEWELSDALSPTLQVGLRLYLGKLEKVSEQQMTLLVIPDDTAQQIASVRDCFNRVSGQHSLLDAATEFRDSIPEGSSVTISGGNRRPVTLHGRKR